MLLGTFARAYCHQDAVKYVRHVVLLVSARHLFENLGEKKRLKDPEGRRWPKRLFLKTNHQPRLLSTAGTRTLNNETRRVSWIPIARGRVSLLPDTDTCIPSVIIDKSK